MLGVTIQSSRFTSVAEPDQGWVVARPRVGCRFVNGWPSARSHDGGIDRIPLPLPHGGLWLCGKHAVGPDPVAAMQRVGATTIVCLTEDDELADRYPAYVRWLRDNVGGAAVWFPIEDLHAPSLDGAVDVIAELRMRLGDGERLLMHCAAGIGRSGTLAACLLMSLGHTREEALRIVAEHRPMAGPEVGAQRALVDAFAASLD